LTLLSDI